MPRGKTTKIEELIDQATPEEEPVPVDNSPEADSKIEATPDITDPQWTDHVLTFLGPKDFDPKGRPYTPALRRVAQKLLGPIVESVVRTVQAPNHNNGMMATVETTVSFAWGGDRGDIRTFSDVTDVYSGNSDPGFARFPSASAKTKAEGRAIKTALCLQGVYTSEEMTEVPISEAGLDGFIVLSQQRFIDKLCRDIDVDVNKFISHGDFRYKHISHVPSTTAKKMMDRLNMYQQNLGKIPEELRGYDPNWRKQEE